MATKRQASGAIKTLRAFVKKCKEAKAAGLHDPGRRKKRKKKSRRDPAWFGHKKAHRKAAKKGWRGRKKKAKSRDPKRRRRRRDPAWFGHSRAHSRAAKKGARTRRRRRDQDPAHYRRGRLGRRGRAAGPWYMTRDPE